MYYILYTIYYILYTIYYTLYCTTIILYYCITILLNFCFSILLYYYISSISNLSRISSSISSVNSSLSNILSSVRSSISKSKEIHAIRKILPPLHKLLEVPCPDEKSQTLCTPLSNSSSPTLENRLCFQRLGTKCRWQFHESWLSTDPLAPRCLQDTR